MKIVFIDSCHPILISSLRSEKHDCVEAYGFSLSELIKVIHDADGIVIRSRVKLDREILSKCERLKFIARAGAGMESIDVNYAAERNIQCLNSPEGNRDAVGEHAVGMLLSLLNNLNRADRQVRNGEWIREGNRGYELQGKTVGLIGYGNMGSGFAEKLSGFDCKVLAYDKYKNNFGDGEVKECSMHELFDATDILSLHVPLTKETAYLVNDDFLSRFRKNIYLVNTARGKCINTDDLVKNLKSGKVVGACLDVIEYEDLSFEKFSITNIKENPSWQYLVNSDNVILTPHIAGWTYDSHEKIARVLVEKIVKTNW
jgi:D-3-phosphoglycerate dehydrogenase